jgi:hypothetical protein
VISTTVVKSHPCLTYSVKILEMYVYTVLYNLYNLDRQRKIFVSLKILYIEDLYLAAVVLRRTSAGGCPPLIQRD